MRREPVNRLCDPLFREAFQKNEREVRIRTGKLACILTILLMPLGAFLDSIVYPNDFNYFFRLRLLCSLLVCVVMGIHFTPLGERHYRWIGLPIVFLPSIFISGMIACAKDPPASPYYAGLNLILLAVSAVGHWSFVDTMISVVGVMIFYISACLQSSTTLSNPAFLGNLYFLSLTGIIVMAGNYLYNRLLFREFELRFELAENRKLLEETNLKLVQLDKVKSRFFANISHELRTPLTLLIGPLEILLKQSSSFRDQTMQTHLETMWTNCLRLLKLINDLLDLVRLESGKMDVKTDVTNLEEFLKGMVNGISSAALQKRISVICELQGNSPRLLLDRDKLEKILLNLLYNSLKFTPLGGKISLLARREKDQTILTVTDTGIGIHPDQIQFVFDRFWQADTSASRKYQGTGIGLALVKELVEVQGGRVTVESTLGVGTTFSISMPWQTAAEPYLTASSVEEAPSPSTRLPTDFDRLATLTQPMQTERWICPVEVSLDPQKPSLLIADDEPDMLHFLGSQLGQSFQIIEAVDGQQALEKTNQFLPDVVVLDMMMPEMDGLRVCQEMRSRTPTRSIPVLLLTARADEETKLAALGAGANDFLSKPFSTVELLARTKSLARSHTLQKLLSQQNQRLEAALEQLKEAQIQVLQSEKLASLGKMSAGIIHEINNPLNYATTGTFNLKTFAAKLQPDLKPEYEDILQDVSEGLQRIKQIISDLRTFTHPDARRRSPESVHKLVSAAIRLLSREWRDRVILTVECDETHTVEVNGNQIIQVLINLIQNAIDALKSSSIDPATVHVSSRATANSIQILVRDNGPGIPTENLNRVFDPFFTTKDVGAGMGLGLSVSFSIMQHHGGRISVQSFPGQYTEFTLDFPRFISESASP